MTSWFFGAPKSNLPAVTPLQAQRSKQIDSLKSQNPSVVELKRDEEYRVTFNCGSNHVSFTISLPPEFPQVKPIIIVSPPMRHGFLDESMKIVRYLPLINFNVHTDLGRMIQTLIQDFSKAPMLIQPDSTQQRGVPTVPQYQHFLPQPGSSPQQLPPLQHPHPSHQPLHQGPPHSHQPPPQGLQHAAQMPTPHTVAPRFQGTNQYAPQTQATAAVPTFPSAASMPSSSSTTATATACGPVVEPNMPVPGMSGIRGLQDKHPYTMPAIPASFDDFLKDLTHQQLEELLEDDEKLEAVFQQLPQLSKMLADRAALYQSCEDIAKLNLGYQPEIDRMRRELEETVKYRNNLKNKFDMKCLQQQSLNEQCSLPLLLDNMRVSAADAEHQSDDLAERFMDNKVSLEDFLKQFSEQRRLLHIRRVKEEKLGQLISQSQGRY